MMQSHRLLLANSFILNPINKCRGGRIRNPSLQFPRKTLANALPDALSHVIRELREPLMRELKGGSWKGFGWGGRRKWGMDELECWGRVLAAAGCLGFWYLYMGGDEQLLMDVEVGLLFSTIILLLLSNGCAPDWVLGVSQCAVVLGLYKRHEWHKANTHREKR